MFQANSKMFLVKDKESEYSKTFLKTKMEIRKWGFVFKTSEISASIGMINRIHKRLTRYAHRSFITVTSCLTSGEGSITEQQGGLEHTSRTSSVLSSSCTGFRSQTVKTCVRCLSLREAQAA